MEDDYRFFKVYSNVPLEERRNTVIVLDGQPVSWEMAYLEIKNKTKKREKILKILNELEII